MDREVMKAKVKKFEDRLAKTFLVLFLGFLALLAIGIMAGPGDRTEPRVAKAPVECRAGNEAYAIAKTFIHAQTVDADIPFRPARKVVWEIAGTECVYRTSIDFTALNAFGGRVPAHLDVAVAFSGGFFGDWRLVSMR